MKIAYSIKEDEWFVRMNNLRGLLALVVLFSHLWGYTGIALLVPFNKAVTIAVAIFFFLSGYGMMRSYRRKEHYLKEIFRVKIPYLCFMAILTWMISSVLEVVLLATGFRVGVYLPVSLKSFLINTNWYVYELIGFYVLFAFAMRFIKEKHQSKVILLASVVAFAALYAVGAVEAYYNSVIGFYIGILCGKYDYVRLVKRYKHGWLWGGAMLAGAFTAMLFVRHDTMVFAAIRNIAAGGAILCLLYTVQYLDPKDSFHTYLSGISPEIYFYHIPVAELLSHVVENSAVYVISVLCITVSIVPFAHKADQWAHGRLVRL